MSALRKAVAPWSREACTRGMPSSMAYDRQKYATSTDSGLDVSLSSSSALLM